MLTVEHARKERWFEFIVRRIRDYYTVECTTSMSDVDEVGRKRLFGWCAKCGNRLHKVHAYYDIPTNGVYQKNTHFTHCCPTCSTMMYGLGDSYGGPYG